MKCEPKIIGRSVQSTSTAYVLYNTTAPLLLFFQIKERGLVIVGTPTGPVSRSASFIVSVHVLKPNKNP